MTRILLTNTNCSWNKGSAAQVISASRTLRRFISNADLTLISYCVELDSKQCAAYDIKVVGYSYAKNTNKKLLSLYHLSYYIYCLFCCMLWKILHKFGLNANSLLNKKILREYAETDIIIDLSGDSFSDSMGCLSIMSALTYLLGISLRKPLVLYSQSIGPFKALTLPLAKFCLDRADLIIVREHITKNYLKSIGIHKPQMYLAAETAFLLEPASCERVREILSKEGLTRNNEPLIGISVSQLIDIRFKKKEFDSDNRYVVLMAQVVDYLTKKFNAQILFIPHVVVPAEWGYDDRFVAEKIYKLAEKKHRIKLIKNEYTPEELKGIIGQCDLFIGGRMHANIAAISMNVPTVAIAWSHKYWGIMRMFDLERHVCNFKTMTLDELISKINDTWSNREKIKKNLMYKVEIEKESALLSGRLIKSLLNSLKSDSF